jgi:hypothetical protein
MATAALILGLWGLVISIANRKGVSGADHGDHVIGIVFAVIGVACGAWALVAIAARPQRGRVFALLGLLTGAVGLIVGLTGGG